MYWPPFTSMLSPVIQPAPGEAKKRTAAATSAAFAGATLLVADLRDVIRSKRVANRPRDRAALPVLEATLREKARRG